MYQCRNCEFIPCACGDENYDTRANAIMLKMTELEDIIFALRVAPPGDPALRPWLEKCLKKWKEEITQNKVPAAP